MIFESQNESINKSNLYAAPGIKSTKSDQRFSFQFTFTDKALITIAKKNADEMLYMQTNLDGFI